MIPIRHLFESHLTVSDLQQSLAFYGGVLGLQLAQVFPDRKAAFYWIGRRGESMLGLWEVGNTPQRLSLHVAFNVDLSDLLQAPERLQAFNITPRDFFGSPTKEPVVLAWMPAASVYFHDPDGNSLEFLSMLPDSPKPELGVVGWSRWTHRHELAESQTARSNCNSPQIEDTPRDKPRNISHKTTP